MKMNCERCQIELEDFLYGELADTRAAQIRTHLTGCASCAAVRDELAGEQEVFTQFYEQTALEPSAPLWDAIQARIGAEPIAIKPPASNERRLQTLLGAISLGWLLRPVVLRQTAFALVLIALSVAATLFFLKRDDVRRVDIAQTASPTPHASATITPQPTPSDDLAQLPPPVLTAPKAKPVTPPRVARPLNDQQLMDQQIARAAREYQKAITLLDQAVAKRKSSLDPNLFKQYEASLALIDDSIAASRRALRERPDDLAAGQFLLAAYAKKVELMQDIAMQ
jgi:hypothetical protein